MTKSFKFTGKVMNPNSLDLKGLFPFEQVIARKVLECWPAIQLSPSNTWTKQLLDCLKQLGRDSGFLVPPFRLGGNTHEEWLFDLVWMEGQADPAKRSKQNKDLVLWEEILTISRMILACESEFGNYEADIVEDFMKLVYCNADFRLFLYLNQQVLHSGISSGHMDPVDACMNCCQVQQNQRYLLIGLPHGKVSEFRIDAWLR